MRARLIFPLAAALAVGACAPALEPPATATPRGPAAPMPPVPAVDGPLRIDVVYPGENETVAAVDSTFIFGSIGSGRAQLTINDAPVQVAPNGAFLAFLPVPRDGLYRVSAVRGGDRADAERRVRLAPRATTTVTGTQIVAGSVTPTGARTVLEGEPVEVAFRGTAGGRAELVLPSGERFPLQARTALGGVAPGAAFVREPGADTPGAGAGNVVRYSGIFPARVLATPDTAVARPALSGAAPRGAAEARRDSLIERCAAAIAAGQRLAQLPDCAPVSTAAESTALARTRGGARVELIVAGDTARAPLRLNLATLSAAWPRAGVATYPGEGAVPADWTVRGRNYPTGPFHYFWPHGTRLTIVGEQDGFYRVRMADGLHAWVPAGDVRLLPAGAAPANVLIGSARFAAHEQAIDLRVPTGERLPFHVEVEDRTIDLFVYGATSTANFFQYGSLDPLIERAEWRQPSDGVFQVRVTLREPVWGYMPFYDAAGALVLRIRRPPPIDPASPLRGLLIAVDPGHPPGGAIGPTRFTEAEANLQIALQLRPLLEAAGARVLMVRSDTTTVALADRPRISTEADADLFVSVHNNAFPDGVNPFENHGTSVYYFFNHSIPLAQAFQRELLAELGLPDIGIGRADLAVVRQTWMPAVLTESMFMMFPEQEAALRDPAYQRRIARAHLRALEAFLRERGGAQR